MRHPESDRGPEEASAVNVRKLGKYKLLASIGRGGMGEVYLAMAHGPASFRKLVVLKCMNAASADDAQLRKMFLDEATLAARLSHHNVVQTYEAGSLDGAPYIAMEYLDGQPLSKIAQVAPEMHPRLAAHILCEALAGVHYAHQLRDFDGTPLSIVHRDLSPPNIFVTYDGVVKVVDFGIAKTSLASRTQTDAGMFKGKISYMAPEQATHEEVDHRADLFSAGAVLWELLAGRRLFRETSPALTLKRLLQDEIPTLSSVVPGVDPALAAIVMRALQRNPGARYQSAQAMRQDLERFLRGGEPANWDAELAALVSEKFASQRQKVQRQVQLCMSQESISGHIPRVSLTDTSSGASGARFVPVGAEEETPAPEIFVDDIPRSVAPETPASDERSQSAQRRMGAGLLVATLAISSLLAAWMVFSSDAGPVQEHAHAAAANEASASIHVLSSPPGAMVFIDGEPSGLATPAVLKGLKPGRSIALRVDKAGYQAKEEHITVTKDQAQPRSFQLLPSGGQIRFAGAPAGARVYVDDVAVGDDATRAIEVPVGSHRIRLEARGTLVYSRIIQVAPGEQTIRVEATGGAR
jgi:serine/threonine protein kinase